MSSQVVVSQREISRPLYGEGYFDRLGLLGRYGKPRLWVAREKLLDSANLYDMGFSGLKDGLEVLEALFLYWRDFNEYLVLKKEDLRNGEVEYVGVKCAKRGNDVYARRLRDRLGWLQDNTDFKRFFELEDFKTDKKVTSRLLWVTLTYNTHRSGLKTAWETIGEDFNKFTSALRSKYGKVSIFRVWEAFKNGYPHIHAVIYFHETDFRVFPYGAKKGSLTFRIANKEDIASLWHSYVDIQAISSTGALFTYIRKHQRNILLGLGNGSVVKEDSDSEAEVGFDCKPSGVLTLALCWLFRKRSFSVSGDFREVMHDLIRTLHNSNTGGGFHEVDLFGEVVPRFKWSLVGIFSGERLGIPAYIWSKKLGEDFVDSLGG